MAYFPKSCQTIRRWIDEITAYFDNRTTQGTVEGINNKLKVIKTHIPHPKLSQREITERKNQSEHKNKHKERKKAFEKQ
jgi:hypothetical protein